MARGLDHIVHAVRDLDAAADLYRRLGFTVGARNKHPWGTHNHIVQLPGFFIEILTLAEPEKLGSDGFSTMFGAYNRDFITRNEGFSLLILESKDAAGDATTLSGGGIGAPDALRFEREAKRPDGTAVKVGFSLAFAEDTGARDIHFAACQQHYPENFWNPAFQQHPNGVTAVAGVVIVAEKPEQHRRFFEVFADARVVGGGDGFAIATPRGAIEVVTPAALFAALRRQSAGYVSGSATGGAASCRNVPEPPCRPYPSSPAWRGFMSAMMRLLGRRMRWGRSWCSNRRRVSPVDQGLESLHGPPREDLNLGPESQFHCRGGRRSLWQCAAIGADCRTLRARKQSARIRDGDSAEGNCRACRHRPRLQDIFRQSQSHVGQTPRAASGSNRRCRFFLKSATS